MSNGGNGGSRAPLSGWSLWAAIAVLAGYAVLVVFMITQIETAELTWTRLAWLFAGVEAIVFGAAGALFGSSIQRQRAESAEQRADTYQKSAANGQALAKVLKADAPTSTAGKKNLETLGAGASRDAAASVAARHAALAEELFPDA